MLRRSADCPDKPLLGIGTLARCTYYDTEFNGCGPFDGALGTSCEDIELRCCESRAENYFEMSPLVSIAQCSALHLHWI
jgi:hypothetical protein